MSAEEMTPGEIHALRRLTKQLGSSRWAVEDYIEAYGWPVSEGTDTEGWNRLTEHQADRYMYRVLRDTEKVSPYRGRLEAWHAPENTVYGIAKPHRLWPAQLLRYLEALRLQKVSTNGTPPQAYTVPWRHFQYVIGREPTVQDISAGIAIHVLETVKHQGLSDEQLTSLLLEGYNPDGTVHRHGYIPSVGAIWGNILSRIEHHPHLNTLTDRLHDNLHCKRLEL